MEPVDRLGAFWLPGHEHDILAGRLCFDPAEGGVRLSLVGSFDHADDGGPGEANVRIHGWLGTEPVTLERCFLTRGVGLSTGVVETRYYANFMLSGHHVVADQEFQTATARIHNAETWVNRSAIRIDREHRRPDDGSSEVYAAALVPLPAEIHEFSRGQLELGFSWNADGDPISGISIRQWPRFTFRYNTPQRLEQIQEDVRLLQNLMTLCIDEAVDLDELILSHPSIHAFMLNGSDSGYEQPIRLVTSPIPYTPHDKRKTKHPYEMLLTFDELGGLSTIARWIDSAPKFRRALYSLLSVKYAERMFGENRLLNVTFAAESYHRTMVGSTQMPPADFEALLEKILQATPAEQHAWLKSKIGYANDPTLTKRLAQLAGVASAATKPITGDRDKWAYTVSWVRNELTHLNAESPDFAGGDLRFLTESVFYVARTCMLVDQGVPAEILAKKAESSAISWYKNRVADALTRVRAEIRRIEEKRKHGQS